MNSTIVFFVKLCLLAAVIAGLDSPAFLGQHKIISRALTAAYTFLSTSVLISISRFAILFFYAKRKNLRKSTVSNFVLGINQLAAILNVTFFVIALFILLGIDIKEFLTSITLIAMAIALIFREYITNMISGLIIMFSDKFEVTDYIKIGEHTGRIENMSLQNTQVINDDGESVLIPNNAFFVSNIVNKSIGNRGRFVITFQLPFYSGKKYDFIENEMQLFFKTYTGIKQLNEVKLAIPAITAEAVQYKVTLEFEEDPGINFARVRSDFLKNILSKI